VLYKTCPEKPEFFDVIGIFPQPLDETLCDVHCFMLVYDENSSHEGMLQWQQGIFLQDRIILENQRPAKLPLEPRMEKPNPADIASVQYRRWLKNLGVQYGTC
jgi:phenylpropionate dioxygenase-like ring-hydroxylating dioxygenase large terminal subunit